MKSFLLFTLFSLSVVMANAQLEITMKSDVRGKNVTGAWKTGSVVLKDGTELEGETKSYVSTANDIKSMKYRLKKGEKATVYKPDAVKYITWDGVIITSLPKNFKKPQKGNRFYTAIYYSKNLSILFDPDAKKATSGLNAGEQLNFLALKDNKITSVNRLKFKKLMRQLCGDSKKWSEKAKDKKWFKYKNIYEVASYYDDNK